MIALLLSQVALLWSFMACYTSALLKAFSSPDYSIEEMSIGYRIFGFAFYVFFERHAYFSVAIFSLIAPAVCAAYFRCSELARVFFFLSGCVVTMLLMYWIYFLRSP